MPVSAFYAGLLALLFVFLSAWVIRSRRSAGVPIGDGANEHLLRRMRVHANFAEYVPYALVLMALAESLESYPMILHGAGVGLVIARLLHAYGVGNTPENFRFRVTGMAMTFAAIATLALTCLVASVLRMFA